MNNPANRIRKTIDDERLFVSIRPGVQFGQPCFDGTRLTVSTIAALWWSGDTVEHLLKDWPELTINAIKLACWYCWNTPSVKRRKDGRWQWARDAAELLWRNGYALVPMPPQQVREAI